MILHKWRLDNKKKLEKTNEQFLMIVIPLILILIKIFLMKFDLYLYII